MKSQTKLTILVFFVSSLGISPIVLNLTLYFFPKSSIALGSKLPVIFKSTDVNSSQFEITIVSENIASTLWEQNDVIFKLFRDNRGSNASELQTLLEIGLGLAIAAAVVGITVTVILLKKRLK